MGYVLGFELILKKKKSDFYFKFNVKKHTTEEKKYNFENEITIQESQVPAAFNFNKKYIEPNNLGVNFRFTKIHPGNVI